MQSKRSCFNRPIFFKNLIRIVPIAVGYSLYLLICVTVGLCIQINNLGERVKDALELQNHKVEILSSSLMQGYNVYICLAVGVGSAIAVFYYLFFWNSCNMIHAFPVSRKELFITNYISGLLTIVIPIGLNFFLTILACVYYEIPKSEYVVYGFLQILVICLLIYNMMIFTMSFCGQLFSAALFFIIFNFFVIGLRYIINHLIMAISFGYQNSLALNEEEVLSPLYNFQSGMRIDTYVVATTMELKIYIKGMGCVWFYMLLIVLMAGLSYWEYQKRDLETVGDFLCISWITPFIQWGGPVCGAGLGTVLLCDVMSYYGMEVSVRLLSISMVCIGVILFYGIDMLLERRIWIFSRKKCLMSGIMVILILGIMTMLEGDVFQLEEWTPDVADIEEGFVNLYQPILGDDQEELEHILQLQRDIIAKKKEFRQLAKNKKWHQEEVTFKYFMKDGSVKERHYMIPCRKEDISVVGKAPKEEGDKILYEIYKWTVDVDQYMENILGKNHKNVKCTGGTFDQYSKGDDKHYVNEVMINAEQIDQIIKAYIKDIKSGAMQELNGRYLGNGKEKSEYWYVNTMTLNVDVNVYSADAEAEYYADTLEEARQGMTQNASPTIFINKQCVNTIQALLDTKIISNPSDLVLNHEIED